MSKVTHLKAAITATLGTVLEWAEYTFFAYLIDHLATQFFAINDPDLARLKTLGIFGTSYLMRPLGAILFGTLGDRRGRKPALMLSMMLMCMATTAIGCLPTYLSIGPMAAVLLMLCRLLQGIAVAGEFHGATIFMVEHHQKNPFFAGSLTPFAAASGMGLGALAATLVLAPEAPAFAWRIPFLCSGFMGLLAIYLRMALPETPIFKETLAKKTIPRFPLSWVLKKDPRAFLATLAMGMFISVYVYIGNVYYKMLCVKVGQLSPLFAAKVVTLGQWLAAVMILLFGLLANPSNGRKLCLTGLSLAILGGPLILLCAQSGDTQWAIFGQVLYAILNGLVSAPMMTLLVNAFHPETRYTGNALAWSLSAALFGGTALLVADLLVNQFAFKQGPGIYISVAALLAFIALSYANKEQESQEVIITNLVEAG